MPVANMRQVLAAGKKQIIERVARHQAANEVAESLAGALTFEELKRLEPRLGRLLEQAQALYRDTPADFCCMATWGGYPGHEPGFKRLVTDLVGGCRKG